MSVQEESPNKLKELAQKYLSSLLYGKATTRALFTISGIALKEFRSSFPQFFTWRSPIISFFRSLKYAKLALLRFFLGRSVRVSYAFTGEDRIIESLLKPLITHNGFYVDVGCNEPRFISNTFLLYRRGWRGICIDGNEKLIKKHKNIRPRDKAVNAFVSNEKKEIEFVELENNVLSSADPIHLQHWIEQGQKIISRKKVITRTLTEILDQEKAPHSFDLLSVDAEEFDLQVLQSLDFNKYRPKLIVTEAEDFEMENPSKHPICSLLLSKGYILKGSILTNLYFMDEKKF